MHLLVFSKWPLPTESSKSKCWPTELTSSNNSGSDVDQMDLMEPDHYLNGSLCHTDNSYTIATKIGCCIKPGRMKCSISEFKYFTTQYYKNYSGSIRDSFPTRHLLCRLCIWNHRSTVSMGCLIFFLEFNAKLRQNLTEKHSPPTSRNCNELRKLFEENKINYYILNFNQK
jgi:hypothetical protein